MTDLLKRSSIEDRWVAFSILDPEGSIIGRYLTGEVIEVPYARAVLEPGRPVCALGQAWACDLAGVGIGIEPYIGQVFRVLPLTQTHDGEVPQLCDAGNA